MGKDFGDKMSSKLFISKMVHVYDQREVEKMRRFENRKENKYPYQLHLSSHLLSFSHSIFLFCVISLLSSFSFAQSDPGSFARIGLNAKGMSMSNSISALSSGDVYTYYNPALSSFQNGGNISASVALLSLDRQLNGITYTTGLKPSAGLSVGIINGTVSNIDERDGNGTHIGSLSTSENEVYFSFSNQFLENFSIGLSLKLYYYRLYSGISSTSIGFDVGALYKVTDFLSVALVETDLGEEYHWDSSSLFGTDGSNFVSPFPHVFKIGAAYRLPVLNSAITAEYDVATSSSLNGLKAGLEIHPIDVIAIRGGFSSGNQQNVGTEVSPTFGFGARISFLGIAPEINYAYVAEPFSPYGIQTISINFGL